MFEDDELSWGMTIKFWWAFTWRVVLVTLPISFIVGAVMAFGVGLMVEMDVIKSHEHAKTLLKPIIDLIGIIIGAIVSLFMIRRLNWNGFGEYRLQIVKK